MESQARDAVGSDSRLGFLRREDLLRILMISGALLAPCLWHKALIAGDLSSHVYNAWLAQLIERGQAQGLWISSQWTNVLFDWTVSGLARILPIHFAGKLAAYFSGLLFFWCAFSFLCVTGRRAAWVSTPLLAMVTFGWTFQRGFSNFYLSVGLAFGALAFFRSQKGWLRIVPVILSPAILTAHPFGFAWFAGAAAYLEIAERLPGRFHYLTIVASVGVLATTRWYLQRNYQVEAPKHSAIFCNGFDQVVLTERHAVLAAGLLLFLVVSVALDLMSGGEETDSFGRRAILLQLYLIAEACVILMPDAIHFPQFAGAISHITERTTAVSAVLLCGLLVGEKARKWQFPVLLGISVVFFALLYRDTGQQNAMEQEMEQLTSTVAVGDRVLVTIRQPSGYRYSTKHILEEACIGRCFAYGNYEASSTQFRVRATPGNRIVMSSAELVAAMEQGAYKAQAKDLPAYQVYQCGPKWMDVCIHPLREGERSVGFGDRLWPNRQTQRSENGKL